MNVMYTYETAFMLLFSFMHCIQQGWPVGQIQLTKLQPSLIAPFSTKAKEKI